MQKEEEIKLSEKDSKIFFEASENPPVPNSGLRKAAKLTKENLSKIRTHDELIDTKYGIDTVERLAFDAGSEAFMLTSKLRTRRKELKLTQQALADKIGVKKSYITRIESGNVDIRLSSFLRILKGLDLDLNTIQTYNRYEHQPTKPD